MTVSTTVRKAGPFSGNDVTTVFPFVFRMFSTADLVVITADADDVEAELLLGVDYNATLNADQDANPGGEITMTVALATGYTMVITSDVPQTQLTLITNAGGFFPKVFNAVFDKAVILIQQLQERLDRAVTIPITATGVTNLQIPVLASAVLQWSPDGSELLAVTLPDLSLNLALPDQFGHANHALYSDGLNAAWRAPLISDVADLGSTLNYLNASIAQRPTLTQTNAALASGIATANEAASGARNFAIAAAVVF